MNVPDPSPKRREREEVDLQLERRHDGQLWATVGARECPVWVCRCFPWSAPGEWISLRDGDEEEVALVRQREELDPESRVALDHALREVAFVLQVDAVDAVEDEIEIRTFHVVTPDGPRRFQTLRDEWPREMPGGGLLIRDVAGDLYRVEDPDSMDRASRKRLWAFRD
jgi:hypothetical protein